MGPPGETFGDTPQQHGAFHTTHWSVVLQAKDGRGQPGEAALEKLCRSYWPPLYAFIRRQGYNSDDAKELTQEFLSRLIHKEWLNRLQHQDGKFRSFLLTFLKNFLSDERDRANAQKRGGGAELISLDEFAAEEHGWLGSAKASTAEEIYDQRWARAVLNQAMNRLREEYIARNKGELFERLKDLQPGKHGEQSYADIGLALGMSAQAVKNAVHSLRRRYSELVRSEVGQTVCDPSELDEEIRYLLRIVSGDSPQF